MYMSRLICSEICIAIYLDARLLLYHIFSDFILMQALEVKTSNVGGMRLISSGEMMGYK
jgi:hypothetical protein